MQIKALLSPVFISCFILGDHVAVVRAMEKSAGNPFSRLAATRFQAARSKAAFAANAFSDSIQTSPAGNITQLTTTALVNVRVAGSYVFKIGLKSRTGSVDESAVSRLSSGSQAISVIFPVSDLALLDADGPFQRVEASLSLLLANGDSEMTAYQAHAGTTAAYLRSSFDRGPMYFTGINSAAGVATTKPPAFDILRAQIGVFSPGGDCVWSGELAGPRGNALDFQNGAGTLPVGSSTISLDFNGNLIAQSGQNGPYTVRMVTLSCPNVADMTSDALFQTPSFTSSQFLFVAQGIRISVVPSSATVLAGSTISLAAAVTALVGCL